MQKLYVRLELKLVSLVKEDVVTASPLQGVRVNIGSSGWGAFDKPYED